MRRLVTCARRLVQQTSRIGRRFQTNKLSTRAKASLTFGAVGLTSAYGVSHDFSTNRQKKAQNSAVKLIQSMEKLHAPEVDPQHSNQQMYETLVINEPTKYANNELLNIENHFKGAIEDGKVDLSKAASATLWNSITKDGINLQKVFDIDGSGTVDFLAFAYTLIIAEALSMTYEKLNRKAVRKFEGVRRDFRVPFYNTMGVVSAKKMTKISDLSRSNPKKFAEFLFLLVDQNGNGVLERNEVEAFVSASRILGTLPDYMYFYKLTDEQVTDTLFKRWDLDENNVFDKTEFLILNQSFSYDHCFAAMAYPTYLDEDEPYYSAACL